MLFYLSVAKRYFIIISVIMVRYTLQITSSFTISTSGWSIFIIVPVTNRSRGQPNQIQATFPFPQDTIPGRDCYRLQQFVFEVHGWWDCLVHHAWISIMRMRSARNACTTTCLRLTESAERVTLDGVWDELVTNIQYAAKKILVDFHCVTFAPDVLDMLKTHDWKSGPNAVTLCLLHFSYPVAFMYQKTSSSSYKRHSNSDWQTPPNVMKCACRLAPWRQMPLSP